MAATEPASATSGGAATIHVGTRKSALAMRQATLVVEDLQKLYPTMNFEIHGMSTMGDKDQQTALYNFGGKGLWTSELEAKLASKELDFIVHCLKDMPTTLPEGMVLGCITEREDPRDVVVFKPSLLKKHGWKTLADLPAGSVIGTSSVRRIAQATRKHPSLKFADVRGNIETRLRKLDDEDGPFSAIILAAAGLLRMNYGDRIAEYLDSKSGGMLYAVGQGALAIEAREDDERVLKVLKGLEHRPTTIACAAERSVMRTLEGGCSVPIGVETEWLEDGKLSMRVTVVSRDGSEAVNAERTEEIDSAEAAHELGKKLAQELVDGGAQRILDIINKDRVGQVEAAATATAPS